MRDSAGQRIGGVCGFHAGGWQETADHRLHLFLFRVPDTDDRLLDVIGRVLCDRQTFAGSREQHHSPGVAEFQGGRGIFSDEHLLDSQCMRPQIGNNRADRIVQDQQARREFGAPVASQHAVPNMREPGSAHVNNAPAHAGETGIEAQDTDRHRRTGRIMTGHCPV